MKRLTLLKYTFLSLVFLSLFSLSNDLYGQSSWQIIQEEIFDKNCTQCHFAGSEFAVQSGLVLTADQAYDNLIDVVPKNEQAAADGLMRVTSIGGLPAPHMSFLWEKINATNQEHYYADHPNYGALMPLGLPPLTNGEIAFITAWIEAGAPESGEVVDPSLLNDLTRYETPEFIPLDPPEEGIQFHVGPFDVWPAELHDREFLYYEPYPTTEDVFVQGYEISMRPGSHHFILYNYPEGDIVPQDPGVYRDLRSQNGNDNLLPLVQLNFLFPFRFFVGTQTPYVRFDFPEGIALRLPPGAGFDLNSHYVNRSTESFDGEVYVNLYTVPPERVERVAQPGNFNNTNITLPPNQVTTLSRTFTFSETQHLIQIWAHAHERMTEFRIERASGPDNGELIYWTNDWKHPPLLNLDPPITFEEGDRVRLVTTYDNQTDQTINFGLLSSDEMQFMFYVYYTGSIPVSVDQDTALPDGLQLDQNYPNPFQNSTTISYRLPQASSVTLNVYNLLGQHVATLSQGIQQPGPHQVTWDASGLPGGVYYVRLESELNQKTIPVYLVP